MEDGKCWMVQNLALGSTTGDITLTPVDSNVTSNFTIPASAVQTSGNNDWSTVVDAIHVYDNGGTWIEPTSAGVNSTVHNTGTPPSQSQYVGNYYNWYTATASTGTSSMTTGNATSSICPKGWRLPTGGANSDMTALTGALVNITTNTGSAQTQSFTIQSSPNYFVLSGYYYMSQSFPSDQGSNGRWWSSTVSTSSDALSSGLRLDTTTVNPSNNYHKHNGVSVRCVADDRTIASIDTMQAMMPEICTNSAIGDSKALRDTRDGKTYMVRKMEDNKCWMTQNLNLGSASSDTTLTPQDSDIAANFTIPASAIQTSGSDDWSTVVDAIHVYNNGSTWIEPTSAGQDSIVHTDGTPPSQSQYVGNYYNWYTVTAGTGTSSLTSGNASGSICPKGWRLPTSGSNSDITGLADVIVGVAINDENNPGASFVLQSAPNYFILGGNYYNGTRQGGKFGAWTTSTASGVERNYLLDLRTSVLRISNGNYYKYYGYAARCIAR